MQVWKSQCHECERQLLDLRTVWLVMAVDAHDQESIEETKSGCCCDKTWFQR